MTLGPTVGSGMVEVKPDGDDVHAYKYAGDPLNPIGIVSPMQIDFCESIVFGGAGFTITTTESVALQLLIREVTVR